MLSLARKTGEAEASPVSYFPRPRETSIASDIIWSRRLISLIPAVIASIAACWSGDHAVTCIAVIIVEMICGTVFP